ncbi:splicing factor YJU2-like [Eucalyptus grandis]|uniref:splicing factor YJU2-like n=1 Tax=Eucalyptus grandis TaxID=71139 RepID=UPI00192ECAC7|nr:splicing factor YJU2-like [Eucalyptus grandis]
MCRRPPPIWPDHDLSRLPVRRPRNRRPTKVRIILPISVRCDACRNSIDKGSEFSSRKEEVAGACAGEAYLGIPEFRFYFGCTGCSAELAINNDQWNSYCIVESGGTRFEGPDVPEGYENATAEDGPWMITLDEPSYRSFMASAQNRGLREEIYRAYATRASSGDTDNALIIDEILKLRLEKTKLLGYDNYVEVSMATRMATIDKAEEFLEKLRGASWMLQFKI